MRQVMRSIVHLSDIHFGRINEEVIAPLIETVKKINPDLVAVSGDLTQRARSHQFREARAFLESLPTPQIVVPGNHDVPLHNVFARFMQPLRKYRRYITDDLRPFYYDDEIAVLGVNTARSLTMKGHWLAEPAWRWSNWRAVVLIFFLPATFMLVKQRTAPSATKSKDTPRL